MRSVLFGLAGCAAVATGIVGIIKVQGSKKQHNEIKSMIALLGDIGGTNIRLELVVIQPPNDGPERIIKKDNLKVGDYPTLRQAIEAFLADVIPGDRPDVSVLAIAGPIIQNTVSMSNVPKWGKICGKALGEELKISHMKFINDFEANSYGLTLLGPQFFETLNKKQLVPDKTTGVMGPGTGLGGSILYTTPFRQRKRVYVLPSEVGHTDFPYVDEECAEYFKFFLKNSNQDLKYISLERCFCGPAIPMIYKFFSEKHPENVPEIEKDPSPEQIINQCLNQRDNKVLDNVLKLWLKLYGAAVGNFMMYHMSVGGVILVGGLTNKLKDEIKKIGFLDSFKQRQSEVVSLIQDIPIVVCTEVDLGLKGSYVMARRIISDLQHE